MSMGATRSLKLKSALSLRAPQPLLSFVTNPEPDISERVTPDGAIMWRRGGRRPPQRVQCTAQLVDSLLRMRPGPHRYLEIGVASGDTFAAVTADRLVGVDPLPKPFAIPAGGALHRVTSSEYFSSQLPSQEGPFDVVFVDGLHLWEVALADLLSGFEWLAPGGFVLVDDVFPSGTWEGTRATSFEEAVANARSHGEEIHEWMGDVWKTIRVVAESGVHGLDWATVRISKSRFHTVLWWDDAAVAGGTRLRDAIPQSLMDRVGKEDIAVLGRIDQNVLPAWYRYQDVQDVLRRLTRIR